MKKLVVFLMVLALSVGLLSGCGASEESAGGEAKQVVIKLSHNQPESSSEHEGAVAFKEKIEELSAGNITVDIYPSLQLGSMREQVEGVQMGSHEMTIQPIAVLTPFIDELQVVDYPFLWPNAEIMWEVLDGEAGEALMAKADEKGFKGLGFWGAGFKNITTTGKEIHMPSDFNGVKMRVMPSPLLIAQYETWGANPVPIEYSELYNALQQKIVDGQENPISTIAMNKFYEVQDNLIISNHGFLAYEVIANKAWFDGLSDEHQGMIIEAEKYAREVQREKLAEMESSYLEEIKDSDINVYELTEEERAAFAEVSKAVHEKFADSDSKLEILNMIYRETE